MDINLVDYVDHFLKGYVNYAGYLWGQIVNPSFESYFYNLVLISIFFFLLEWIMPWRKEQKLFRKDFWLDAFYMFFNFFLFSLIFYKAASEVVVHLFNDVIKNITGGWDFQSVNPMRNWPMWAVLLVGFVVRDFIQWWVHRMLHAVPAFWNFHKVHHSVEEMGFAAHLRFHWMETIIYRVCEYIPLALLGVGLYDFFIVYTIGTIWGHYNHSNISINGQITGAIVGAFIGASMAFSWFEITVFQGVHPLSQWGIVVSGILGGGILLGPIMKYIFNSPEMHIWHHSYTLPKSKQTGVNFGLTLSIWDYIFRTNYIPKTGRDIPLGFPQVESFPKRFVQQFLYGFRK